MAEQNVAGAEPKYLFAELHGSIAVVRCLRQRYCRVCKQFFPKDTLGFETNGYFYKEMYFICETCFKEGIRMLISGFDRLADELDHQDVNQ